MENNRNNQNNQTSDPSKENEERKLQPKPDTEVNPGKRGNNTEVDLDKEQTKTYPGSKPDSDSISEPGERY